MFRFFKRKKGSKETVVDQTQLDAEALVQAEQTVSEAEVVADLGLAEASSVEQDAAALSDVAIDRSELAQVESLNTDNSMFREMARPLDEPSSPVVASAEPMAPFVQETNDANVVADEPVSDQHVVPTEEPSEVKQEESVPPPKKSWLSRLRKGLSRTGQTIGGIFVGVNVDEALFDELEMALIMSDAGVEATEKLLTTLRTRVRKERLSEGAQVKQALKRNTGRSPSSLRENI